MEASDKPAQETLQTECEELNKFDIITSIDAEIRPQNLETMTNLELMTV